MRLQPVESPPAFRAAAPPTQPEPQRLRFAKQQISRALEALELVDRDQFDYAMRSLGLEDQLEDARKLTAAWRRGYERAIHALAEDDPASAASLDQAIRGWVGEQ